jgi:hypothetical protein
MEQWIWRVCRQNWRYIVLMGMESLQAELEIYCVNGYGEFAGTTGDILC